MFHWAYDYDGRMMHRHAFTNNGEVNTPECVRCGKSQAFYIMECVVLGRSRELACKRCAPRIKAERTAKAV